MDKQSSKILDLFARYFVILLVGIGNLYLFYKVLTPITVRAVAAILDLFSNPLVIDNMIFLKRVIIEIVPACVAGSAFYLLFLLVVSTAEMNFKKRFLVLVTSFSILFFLNTLRLVLLVPLVTTPYFDTIHWIFWHLISTVFVVAVWVSMVFIYKIKAIPVYSDIKFLVSLIKGSKVSEKPKRLSHKKVKIKLKKKSSNKIKRKKR
jgi:exosortase/archaeosortase family protein